jgi:hypothetical protein
MHTHRLALAAACLVAVTAFATARAAQPDCKQHKMATAVAGALGQDAQDTARHEAMERASRFIPSRTLGSVWNAVASNLPHRKKKKEPEAEPAPATSTPDCQ